MTNMKKTLMTGAAALTLVASGAFAQEATTETDLSAQVDNGEVSADVDTGVKADMNDALDDMGIAAENATEATGDAMSDAADGVSDMANDMGDAVGEAGVTVYAFSEETIDEITGTKVLSAEGNDIGEIDGFTKIDGELVAIVGMGGFLGIAEHDVAVSVENFTRVDEDTLRIEGHTEAELEAMVDIDQSEIEWIDGDLTFAEVHMM
ncbi:hypothetical protein [Celeribacter arenosi]|uniref:PRC-barrel domain-containing protein n=1 Tax=Celeribacter arenosi TaxID=792649 RepID=A0ABP7JVN4_9RHOB